MRLVVTGLSGQIATALAECAVAGVTVIRCGRPDLDLARPATLDVAIRAARPDAIVNAAAYTAVDQAESEPDLAHAINGAGAGAVAGVAAGLGVPLIQLSTDYVFDGTKSSPYVETDAVGPVGVYGASKLAGELAVAAATPNHAILRTAWVFSPHGRNFVRTMLRLAATQSEVAVVADQRGCPSYAPDIASAIIAVARNLVTRPDEPGLRGVFHVAGGGEADWAGFAEAIFAGSRLRGGPSAAVRRIATADYPTAARRPANSRLDCAKLRAMHNVGLGDWSEALQRCLDRLIDDRKELG